MNRVIKGHKSSFASSKLLEFDDEVMGAKLMSGNGCARGLRRSTSLLRSMSNGVDCSEYGEPQKKLAYRRSCGDDLQRNNARGEEQQSLTDFGNLTVQPRLGVYTNMSFEEEELILKDRMIVGLQHSSNKIDCRVGSFCFRFIGSIELQIGRKLFLQEMGLSLNNDCHSNSSDEDDNSCMNNHYSVGPVGECSTSSSVNKIPLPKEIVDSLMNSQLRLPFSEKFLLPSAIPCLGGCGEAFYCSKSCAEMDWDQYHSILCTRERSLSSCRKALTKFVDHANDTNDIFLLAAKTISFTILRYRKLRKLN